MRKLRLERFAEAEHSFDEDVTETMSADEKLAYLIRQALEWHREEMEISFGILREVVSLDQNVAHDVWEALAEAAHFMGAKAEAEDAAWNADVVQARGEG